MKTKLFVLVLLLALALQGQSMLQSTLPAARILQTCQSPAWYLDPTTNQCQPCDVAHVNCMECTNATVCSLCFQGYTWSPTLAKCSNTTTTTPSCTIANCTNCSTTSPNMCDVCATGFYLDLTNGQCVNCMLALPGCLECTKSTYCMVCAGDYYLDQITGGCVVNSCNLPNCLNCSTTSNACLACKVGFLLDSTGSCSTCKDGFFLDPTGSCSNCSSIPNCFKCTTANNCTECVIGFSVQAGSCSVTQSTCQIGNCTTCNPTNLSMCEICASGFYLNFTNGQCGPCGASLTGCIQCDKPTFCRACAPDYLYISSNGTCSLNTNPLPNPTCSVANCANCTSTGTCLACTRDANMWMPNLSGTACVTCNNTMANMIGCMSCNSSNSCSVCITGYQLSYVQNTGICIKCTIANCLKCELNGTISICVTCAAGYNPVLLGQACSACSFPCETCTNQPGPNNCASCKLPYFFATPAADGSCIKNYIQGCTEPNQNNVTLCAKCSAGFVLSPDGLFCNFTCAPNCLTCSSSTNCTTCTVGYFLNSTFSCSPCTIKGCESCKQNTCITCLKGFYLVGGVDCAPCPSFCLDCTSNTSCNSLSDQSQVLMTIGNQTVLASCEATCLKCSDTSNTICLICIEGFFLSNGKCVQCAGNCQTCDTTNTSKCLTCYPNNFLNSSNYCVACNSICKTCVSADLRDNCTSCWEGSSLSGSVCVKGCPKNCLSCSSLTNCNQCNSGFTLFKRNGSMTCAPCVTNCRSCAEGKPSICLNCGSGFYLVQRSCKKCPQNCPTCTATACLSCAKGFYLTADQKCAPNCISPCATCSTTNPKSCITCMAGFSINGTLCTPSPNCTTSCKICPEGFGLLNGKCLNCSTNNCQSCNPSNLNQCYTCKKGSYLTSAGVCEVCPPQCEGCLTATGCLSCATGYTMRENAVRTAGGFECIKCNSPCATCTKNPDYCLSCIDGYDFFGWKCAQKFRFSFNLTLNVDMNGFEQKYMDFILAIAKATGLTDINGVTFNNIYAGSVNIQGDVAPDAPSGTKEAGVQLVGLQTALQGAEIEGMPVGSSSIVIEEGTVANDSSNAKNMLPIILGICIPIAVLILVGVIVFFVYGKKNATSVNRLDTEGDAKDNFNKSNMQLKN